jgi:hypothetical protein
MSEVTNIEADKVEVAKIEAPKVSPGYIALVAIEIVGKKQYGNDGDIIDKLKEIASGKVTYENIKNFPAARKVIKNVIGDMDTKKVENIGNFIENVLLKNCIDDESARKLAGDLLEVTESIRPAAFEILNKDNVPAKPALVNEVSKAPKYAEVAAKEPGYQPPQQRQYAPKIYNAPKPSVSFAPPKKDMFCVNSNMRILEHPPISKKTGLPVENFDYCKDIFDEGLQCTNKYCNFVHVPEEVIDEVKQKGYEIDEVFYRFGVSPEEGTISATDFLRYFKTNYTKASTRNFVDGLLNIQR